MLERTAWLGSSSGPTLLAAALIFLAGCGLAGCGGEPEGLTRPSAADARPRAQQPDEPLAPPAARLSCQQRQGRQYVAPAELPTWEGGMRVLVNNRCLPCHNRNFAAAGLKLTGYRDYEAAAASSVKRIETGLLKPIAAHESYSLVLWLLNGLPRTAADTAAWPKSRCVTLP